MAIIEDLGLEVKVLVNGSAATEYIPDEDVEIDDDFVSSTNTCCRYAESIDNAHFAIYAKVKSGNKAGRKWIETSEASSFSVGLSFDGGRTATSFLLNRHCTTRTRQGVVSEMGDTMRRFRFASVSTVDSANKQRIAKDLATAKSMGLIRVVFRRIIVTDARPVHRLHPRPPRLATGDISLAEKALKGRAVSHGTALSAPVRYNNSTFVSTSEVDSKNSPFAVFYFMYRSKEALQQELIIPRPRSLSMEFDVDNLSPDELRRLARERLSQMKGDNKRAASIKDENDEAPRPSRPHKLIKTEGGKEVIDLTEDD